MSNSKFQSWAQANDFWRVMCVVLLASLFALFVYIAGESDRLKREDMARRCASIGQVVINGTGKFGDLLCAPPLPSDNKP